jgi:Kef-type K+ transport system membrane component KefB
LLGPHVTNVVPNSGAMFGIGDIGIALLLFLVGMELNPAGCGG